MSKPLPIGLGQPAMSPRDQSDKVFRGVLNLLPRADIDKLAASYCGLNVITLHSRQWLMAKIIAADCSRMRRDVGHMALGHITQGR